MGLNYENDTRNIKHASKQYWAEWEIGQKGEFPECKGLYPDCPETPSLLDSKCRICPKTENENKPKLEWIDCEHCKEEEVVPFDTDSPLDKNEDTKCHSCGKTNSVEWIKKQRKQMD